VPTPTSRIRPPTRSAAGDRRPPPALEHSAKDQIVDRREAGQFLIAPIGDTGALGPALHRLGIDFTSPAPGCCGMAGSFGFHAEHYEISQTIGELELLPAVRQAPDDWLIIADGFSCREQIFQSTGRRALHLAEVIEFAGRSSSLPSHTFPK